MNARPGRPRIQEGGAAPTNRMGFPFRPRDSPAAAKRKAADAAATAAAASATAGADAAATNESPKSSQPQFVQFAQVELPSRALNPDVEPVLDGGGAVRVPPAKFAPLVIATERVAQSAAAGPPKQ